eukprot:GHRR01029142.1.p2 GENE.GHRR01029142.1~~GHRR01029142.1.p2  ORF type:complete len:110 (+),score=15.19 GHRR01029142.1:618-947(+)
MHKLNTSDGNSSSQGMIAEIAYSSGQSFSNGLSVFMAKCIASFHGHNGHVWLKVILELLRLSIMRLAHTTAQAPPLNHARAHPHAAALQHIAAIGHHLTHTYATVACPW